MLTLRVEYGFAVSSRSSKMKRLQGLRSKPVKMPGRGTQTGRVPVSKPG